MDELLDRKHTGLMLAVVFFATFMDGLDGSIVNVALPDIGSGFEVDTSTVSWVSITYMMVLAGTLVAFAKVASEIGVKKIMMWGLGIFTVGSLMCGLSPSFAVLILSRGIQAVGAAMMAATGPMCCVKHLPPEKLAYGLSIVTIGASVGFAVGPALGGAIVEFTTWYWIFLINIPLGLIAIPLMAKAIPAGSEKNTGLHLDIAGTVLLFAAIMLVTFAIETLSHSDMRVWSVCAMAVGLVLLAVFVKVEKKQKDPLLELSMFRRWDFTSIFLCLMMINMIFMGIQYLIPFYGEICLGMSSLTIGLFLLVSAMVTAIFGMPMAKWSNYKGRRPFCIAAGLLAALSFGTYIFFAEDMPCALLFVCMVLMGLSWACVGGPMASRLVEHAGDQSAMASSLTNEAYYIGGAIGTALVAMIFTLSSGTDGVDIENLTEPVFLDGFTVTAAVVTAVALLIAFLSYSVRDDKKERRSRELRIGLGHELLRMHDEPLVEPGPHLAELIGHGDLEPDAGPVDLHYLGTADHLRTHGGCRGVFHVHEGADGGVPLGKHTGNGCGGGLFDQQHHLRGGEHGKSATPPGGGRVFSGHEQFLLTGGSDRYHVGPIAYGRILA